MLFVKGQELYKKNSRRPQLHIVKSTRPYFIEMSDFTKKTKMKLLYKKEVPDKKVNEPISHHSESNQGQFDICDFHYSRMLYQLSYGESPR